MTWIPCSPDTHEHDLFSRKDIRHETCKLVSRSLAPCRSPMRNWTSYYGPRSNKPDCCGSVTATKTGIVEPHDYGQHNGVIKLLTWQIGGSSSGPLPNWRWMEYDQIAHA